MQPPPKFYTSEKYLSQLPALQVLQALGYGYIPAKDAMPMRQGRAANVILETVLLDSLRHINRYTVKGVSYDFSDGSLHNAIAKLKHIKTGGFITDTAEKHEFLLNGTTEAQITDGDKKDKSIRYIDWQNIDNNRFHMVAEYTVERTAMVKTYRPDIVLFVNGIPFAIIECKAPATGAAEAIQQHIRNQKPDGIRPLYQLSQILLATDGNDVRYATTNTPVKYWAKWQEQQIPDTDIAPLIQHPCPAEAFADVGIMGADRHARTITAQDRAIVGLLSPERLLTITRHSIVFDRNQKKIARYQQHYAVDKIMKRVQQFNGTKRQGGVIWHTQGSGKSLTMVMTAMKIAASRDILSPLIIIVTDRTDLDEQIFTTFMQCGYDEDTIHRSASGRDLLDALKAKKATVITTLVHKFQTVIEKGGFVDPSPNIFVMVDEAHRTQFGKLHAFMERSFPNASFIGFTGTPISKKDKSTYAKFGLLIDKYTIDQAIDDGAIVPLLYEARHALQDVNTHTLNVWFDRVTKDLTAQQAVDLKNKYARSEIINTNDSTLHMFAWDINAHFKKYIKPHGFKGQIVAPNRQSAVKIKRFLDALDDITSEVVITLSDTRKNSEQHTAQGNTDILYDFTQNTLDKYGDEGTYTKLVVDAFKDTDSPDVVIVVDKLLTGFDVPQNAVIYLCKRLSGHTLLQAIARVNRLYEGKQYGRVIDYMGVLRDLHTSLTEYTALQDFDEADLSRAVRDVKKQVSHLHHHYKTLMGIFKGVKHTSNMDPYIDVLRNPETRDNFYQAVGQFSKTLDLALSTTAFYDTTDDRMLKNYKHTEKKYQKLRWAAKQRFGEVVDFAKYEQEIKRLIDQNVVASDVIQTIQPLDIMNKSQVCDILQDSTQSTAAKADTIASATARTITEKIDQDPAFYTGFGDMLQEIMQAYRDKRLHEEDYLQQVIDLSNKVAEKRQSDLPDGIRENTFEAIIYGNIKQSVTVLADNIRVSAAQDMAKIAKPYTQRIDFPKNIDAQKHLKNQLDDYMYQVEKKHNIKIGENNLAQVFTTIVDLTAHNSI